MECHEAIDIVTSSEAHAPSIGFFPEQSPHLKVAGGGDEGIVKESVHEG